eukprot:Platyproteum_vivax@DN16797_c0_g1_i1.p3
MCLVCGRICCLDSECCKRNGVGECSQHALECGGGQTVFLLINLTMVLACEAPRCAFMEAPYVDDHGECDSQMRRGRPLKLSWRRLSELQMMLTTSEVGREIIRNGERTSRYIPRAL